MPLQASKTPSLGRYNDDVPFTKESKRNVQGAPVPKPVFTIPSPSFPFQINVFVAMLLELAVLLLDVVDFALLLDFAVVFTLLLDFAVVDFTELDDFAVVDFTLLLDFVVLDFGSVSALPSNPMATIVSPLSTDAFLLTTNAIVFASFLINE